MRQSAWPTQVRDPSKVLRPRLEAAGWAGCAGTNAHGPEEWSERRTNRDSIILVRTAISSN